MTIISPIALVKASRKGPSLGALVQDYADAYIATHDCAVGEGWDAAAYIIKQARQAKALCLQLAEVTGNSWALADGADFTRDRFEMIAEAACEAVFSHHGHDLADEAYRLFNAVFAEGDQ